MHMMDLEDFRLNYCFSMSLKAPAIIMEMFLASYNLMADISRKRGYRFEKYLFKNFRPLLKIRE